MMRVIRDWQEFPQDARSNGTVVLIGSFDGLHLGHQKLINMAKQEAITRSLPLVLITFEPSPKNYFLQQNKKEVSRLLTFYDKAKLLETMGIDFLVVLKFNQKLISCTPESFLDKLNLTIAPVTYYLGQDFKFGKNRTGHIATVQNYATKHNQKLVILPTIKESNSEVKISSTLLRTKLAEGDLCTVKRLLNRPYLLSGKVCLGKKLGRTLGFNTANVMLKRCPTPLRGVYAVRVCKIGPQAVDYAGVANIGIRPTLHQDNQLMLEVHILDQNLDLYGQRVTIEFVQKIRDEKKFPNLEALQKQIQEDGKQARLISLS